MSASRYANKSGASQVRPLFVISDDYILKKNPQIGILMVHKVGYLSWVEGGFIFGRYVPQASEALAPM